MLRILLAGFLLAHGLIHVGFLTPAPAATAGGPPWPFNLDRSWLLNRVGVSTTAAMALGRGLVIGTVAAFAVAAAALVLDVAWWAPAVVAAAVLSTVQLTIWFHWWLPVGLLIDVALVAAVVGRWDVVTRFGA
jgi:hypothetical protein